ncbi:hypothetical protein SAMN05216429_10897 [Marinobacter persicus]|uniref:DUF6844 domain-containing protein n=1 Tax=Marinobacter persicus TaxID=930118 RepID=A0A1I3VP40_9GAMM|nr:hypothetical protein [Marinobacter persicus]GHD50485.1 hypothetical protein GCM10008110_21400 [Marinobacter persicus]SFJ97015.1 hypothetical protein SAMN05216429_10897 [Marinobacter persicus]
MTIRKKALSVMVATVLVSAMPAMLMAQDSDIAAQTQAAEEDASKTPPSPFMAVSEVDPGDKKIQEFLDARGWVRGQSEKNPAGGTLVVASQAISADPTNISFSQARIIATEEAFLKAMGELVSQDSVDIGVAMVDRFMKDDLPEDVRDTTSIEALGEAIAGRAAELTVQGMNALLEELGADTSKMPEMTIAERKNMIYDEFVSETTWQAMGRLSGVGIFGVIEEVGGDGPLNNGRMSVVVVRSDRFSEFGRQLRTGDVAPGQAISLDEIRERLDPQLREGTPMLGYFGVQPVVDKQGRYGLMSFGTSGPQLVRGTMEEFEIAAEMEAAREEAMMMADGWLAQFASMTVQGQKEATRRKIQQKVRETRGDGSTEFKTSEGTGRMVNNILRSEANARLTGIQTVGQWDAVDPATGHPYLGYVKYWSPATSAKAQGLDKKPEPASNGSSGDGEAATKKSTRSTGSFGSW